MAEKSSTQQLAPFACATCRGIGVVGNKPCDACNGWGTIVRQGPLLLYWGRPIDRTHLLQRQGMAIAEQAWISLLLCFAALGTGALLWQLMVLGGQGYPPWIFWQQQNVWMLTFWASVFVDSYLVYYFSLELAKIRYLPRRILRGETAAERPKQWSEAVRVARKNHLELSTMFSRPAVTAVEKAWATAARLRHHAVAPVHLLVALVEFSGMLEMFVRLGVPFAELQRRLRSVLPKYAVPTGHQLTFNAEFFQALFAAYVVAWNRRQKKVDLADLLVAAVAASATVRDLLYEVDIDADKINNVAEWFRIRQHERHRYVQLRKRTSFRPRKSKINRSMTAIATPFLDAFSQDLTALARGGYLEPCLDREKEISEIFRVLTVGGRDSAILVGNPGIGKRTIANGIAQLMAADDVPKFLQDKRLVSLSVAKIISGASASVAQERLLHCLDEAARSGNIVLFINDVSKMVGVSAGGGSALDLAGALAQALLQTHVSAIATALPADYSKYVENHTLGQVMERVAVEEPAGNAAIQILQAKSGPIEARYHVFFTYDAVAKSVQLSSRYLHDRYLPEKAIEILDETAIRVCNEKGRDASVRGQDIARTVSEKTNIPLTEVTRQESEKLLKLEEEIHRRMVDQDEAVTLVSAAIRRARAELRDAKRPIVNLLFLGPTGVGKTELAKTVAAVYFGRASEMIRLDMSEYQEKSSINQLLGAPPGFEGGGTGGYLTESVRRHPFSLVLLDEIEKAHPDILNLFLQVMDDGRLTDAAGRTIDFTNVILIATSNACTPTIQRLVTAGMAVPKIKEQLFNGELMQYFRPEFINRFDGVVVFKPLGMAEVRQITRLMMQAVRDRLSDKGMALVVTEAAIDELAAAGFDPQFGARPLRRVIQDRVDDAIATKMLAGELQRRDTIILDVGGALNVKKPAKL